MYKILLTGAPGSGKTSICTYLELKGEYVVREAATDYISLRQAQGIKKPWLEKDFQTTIMELSMLRELRIQKDIRRVFLDRTILDGQAYVPESDPLHTLLLYFSNQEEFRYDMVFIISQLGTIDQNAKRRENYRQAKTLENKLKEVYTQLNYPIYTIKKGSVKKRAEQIYNKLTEFGL